MPNFSGERPTKFGIYADRLDEAVAVARRHDLTIDTLHFHAGSGWLGDGLPAFEVALASATAMARRLLVLGCPPAGEGDIAALLTAGGYEQAMSTDPCLRPTAPALFLERSDVGAGRAD